MIGLPRTFAGAAVSVAAIAAATPAVAQTQFNISPQQAAGGVAALARQSGERILIAARDARGKTTREVRGAFTTEQAMARLLEGSGLTARKTGPGEWAAVSLADAARQVQPSSSDETAPPAEESDSGSAAAEEAAAKGGEIIVTAQKREERLQDVPLSVSVLDEERLIKLGATELIDYATKVPNLAFGATGDAALGLNSITIRGIAGPGTTGFYIDDVPLPESINPQVIDIDSIEVLRGPQGSLYGARSMGGTVRLITKGANPSRSEARAHLNASNVSKGSWNYAADAAINVPVSTNAAIRVNGYYVSESGVYDIFIDNPNIAGDENIHKNADDAYHLGFQAAGVWNATDRFTVEPRFLYQRSHIDWVPYADIATDNFTQVRVVDVADPNDNEWSVTSLTLKWAADWGLFTSATAYLHQQRDDREEFSGFINFLSTVFGGDPTYFPPGGSLIHRDLKLNQFTEEFRFVSDFSGPLNFIGGVFYSDSHTDIDVPCSFAIGFSEATGIPFGTDCIFTQRLNTDITELAFFGEAEWAIRNNLFLTLGGRYFKNKIEQLEDIEGIVVDFGAPPGPERRETQKGGGFNPKAALKWTAARDATFYGSVAKGYRIGGISSPVPVEFCADDLAAIGLSEAPSTFDSDTVWSYEIGAKGKVPGSRHYLNAAAFLIDWQDIQQTILLPCGFAFIGNTGKARVEGFEVELFGTVVDNLNYALGAGYTNARITDPEFASGVSKGDRLPQVPKWTLSGNLEYQFNVGRHPGYANVNYSWIDSSVSINQGIGNPRERPSYSLLDARVGLTMGNWDISLFAKNLLNEHANLSDQRSLAAEDPFRPRVVVNRPRTIGLDLRWRM